MDWFSNFLGLGNNNPQNDLNFGGYTPTSNISPTGFIPSNSDSGTINTFNTGSVGIPQTNNSRSWFTEDGRFSGGKGGGLEGIGGISGIADILAGLGNTWNGFQQQKNARKALNFQKDAFNRTFTNNNKVYNQNMEDVLRARSAQTGQNYDNVIAERRL